MWLLFVFLYILFFLYYKYYKSVFNPSSTLLSRPVEVEEVYIDSGSYRLCVWQLLLNEEAPTLLYFHGNNLNITFRSYAVSLAKLWGVNLILPDYRGFGKSQGCSSPASLMSDALTSYSHALSLTKSKKIILWGESLGGYAASCCLLEYYPFRLVLFSTFSNIRDVSPRLLRPLFLFFSDLNNKNMISRYLGPSLVIHSKEDTFIPFTQAERNLSLLHDAKLLEIEGDHSTPKFTLDNFYELTEFLSLSYPEEGSCKEWIEAVSKGLR